MGEERMMVVKISQPAGEARYALREGEPLHLDVKGIPFTFELQRLTGTEGDAHDD